MDTLRLMPRSSQFVAEDTDYKPLAECGPAAEIEAPEHCELTMTGFGDEEGGAGLGTLFLRLRLVAGRYEIERIEATGPDGGYLDLEAVRRFNYRAEIRRVLTPMLGGRALRRLPNPVGGDPPYRTDEGVAVIYALAKAAGENPTRAVAESLQISPAAAAQRVRRLRQKNLIDPTTQGKV